MESVSFEVQGPILLKPKCFRDERGYFMEAFNANVFAEVTGERIEFVQDNQSRSIGSVVRGLHYQLNPKPQGKLVRCVKGTIFDVAVDIRAASPTFGHWVGAELSEENLHMLWIPPGFAHGFATLTEVTDVFYKVTNYFDKNLDRSILWSDASIGIRWPQILNPIVSAKDAAAPLLKFAEIFA